MRNLLLTLLIATSEIATAQTEFLFHSTRERIRTEDFYRTSNFRLKTGRNADTLFLDSGRIIGTIIKHGQQDGDFYILYTALLDTNRIRMPSNYDLDRQYIFYTDKTERRVLYILSKSLRGMIWYYKK